MDRINIQEGDWFREVRTRSGNAPRPTMCYVVVNVEPLYLRAWDSRRPFRSTFARLEDGSLERIDFPLEPADGYLAVANGIMLTRHDERVPLDEEHWYSMGWRDPYKWGPGTLPSGFLSTFEGKAGISSLIIAPRPLGPIPARQIISEDRLKNSVKKG